MFTKEKVVVLKIIQNAFCASFQFMGMQSNLLAPESALNWLRHLLFYEVRKLRNSNVLQIGIDHTLEISEKEIKKADSEVDYDWLSGRLATLQQISLYQIRNHRDH